MKTARNGNWVNAWRSRVATDTNEIDAKRELGECLEVTDGDEHE